MFNKEDYLQFVDELFRVEKVMEDEGRQLLKMVDNEEAKRILNTFIKDEIRHQGIVKEMRKLID